MLNRNRRKFDCQNPHKRYRFKKVEFNGQDLLSQLGVLIEDVVVYVILHIFD